LISISLIFIVYINIYLILELFRNWLDLHNNYSKIK